MPIELMAATGFAVLAAFISNCAIWGNPFRRRK